MRFTTAERMAEIDRSTIEEHQITNEALMETAGQLTARHARNYFLSPHKPEGVVVLCGKGHNGADGMVAARWLAKWGYHIQVIFTAEEEELGELPRQQAVALHKNNKIKISQYKPDKTLPAADLYLDGLLGTGLDGDPRAPYDEIIDRLNRKQTPVVSIDTPSGLCGDYHMPYSPCVDADLTVTMGLPKLGMLLEPGYTKAGKIIVQELGFPASTFTEHAGPCHLITPFDLQEFIPRRAATDHKGNSGRVMVIAGSKKFPGAAFLAANSAAKAGAGLVSMIGPENLSEHQGPGERDIIFSTNQHELLESKLEEESFLTFLKKQHSLIIGPGLGQIQWKKKLLKKILPKTSQPVVIDADGLNNLSDGLGLVKNIQTAVLTPHPGELSRLLDRNLKSILSRPLESVKKLVDLTGQTVVLKTSRPIIGHPDGSYSINVSGSPALAKAGSGDVLTGLIGALLGDGLKPGPAACLGCFLHGAAGRKAASSVNELSVRAEDVINNLPAAINLLKSGNIPDWFPLKFESHSWHTLQWNPFQK